ncbi:MAG: threonine-phosphate decarboxylase CobD [Henriciella sp.]
MSDDLHHGGAIDAMRTQFPEAPEPWLDLSTGINPWPYPKTDVPAESLTSLPSRSAYQACQTAMAAAIGAPPDTLCLAPGSELLIRLLPTLIQPKSVALYAPSYGDHEAVWRQAGATVIASADPLSLAGEVDAVVVCNPNNPDGRTYTREALETALGALAARKGWLIIDEAFGDLTPELSMAAAGGAEGLIVLRSFGKFYGLPGLRLGAMIAPTPIRTELMTRLGAWPVSGPALAIGARAYRDVEWQAQTRAGLKAASERLEVLLEIAGVPSIGGTDLFKFVQLENAHAAWKTLARQGIYVRRFDYSDQHLRIGLPATEAAEHRLREALSLLD